MKAITASMTKALETGSRMKCADNSGAKIVEIISIKGYKGVMRRRGSGGVGSVVICAVKKGNPKIKHEVVKAVIVRQRKEYRRHSGIRVKFEDNAVVLVNDKFEPRGTTLKGAIAKEVVERFPVIGKIASIVV